jgi:hypothetical protein
VLRRNEGEDELKSSESVRSETNRKILEARKILDIQEGLGLHFSGNRSDEVQLGVMMEDNDRAIIEDWERRNDQ